MSKRRRKRHQKEQTAQSVPDCSQEEDASFPEDYAIISYEDMPQEEEEKDSPSPEVYMKRIKWLSFFANLACHLAVWILILSLIFLAIVCVKDPQFFSSPNACYNFAFLSCVVTPLSLGFANMIMANIIMVNIRKYCNLVYSDENIRIQEIRQLVLEYIGLTSSHFITSYFSIR